jgi:hypothetical protein
MYTAHPFPQDGKLLSQRNRPQSGRSLMVLPFSCHKTSEMPTNSVPNTLDMSGALSARLPRMRVSADA